VRPRDVSADRTASAIELELGRRLDKLLWRLRRASSIETGPFGIQAESLIGGRQEAMRIKNRMRRRCDNAFPKSSE
jgi:hypothetical protein